MIACEGGCIALRTLRHRREQHPSSTTDTREKSKSALPQFKQYRESDGKFYFKLLDGDGRVLLQSIGFASPKDAGQAIAMLRCAETESSIDDSMLSDDISSSEVLSTLHILRAVE